MIPKDDYPFFSIKFNIYYIDLSIVLEVITSSPYILWSFGVGFSWGPAALPNCRPTPGGAAPCTGVMIFV